MRFIKKSLRITWLVLVCVFLNACQSNSKAQTLLLEPLYRSDQCVGQNNQSIYAYWSSNEEQFAHTYKRFIPSRLGLESPLPPKVDFNDSAVLSIIFETKPNMGYSIDIANEGVINQQVLSLSATFATPEKGSVYAQISIRPCFMFKIPTSLVSSVRLLSTDGTVLLQIPKP
jgi:hypothetical protein